eukprot:1155608-Pelagomonas_calceolata.AAC.3
MCKGPGNPGSSRSGAMPASPCCCGDERPGAPATWCGCAQASPRAPPPCASACMLLPPCTPTPVPPPPTAPLCMGGSLGETRALLDTPPKGVPARFSPAPAWMAAAAAAAAAANEPPGRLVPWLAGCRPEVEAAACGGRRMEGKGAEEVEAPVYMRRKRAYDIQCCIHAWRILHMTGLRTWWHPCI